MPRPAYHLFVCTQNRAAGHPRGSCAEKGSNGLYEQVLQQLQMSGNPAIKVTACGCLGPCGGGPTLLVYPEGVLYGGLSGDDVTTIFQQHLTQGQPVERLMLPEGAWG